MKARAPRRPATLGLQLLHEISVEAAAAHSTEELVQRLVHRVQQALDVDVCSLYRLGADDALHMAANIGLNPAVANTISVPTNRGLVGAIATSRLPLNLRRASEHDAYLHITDSGEERFQAFLGVPIIDLGEVIGVLVVQDREEGGFSQDEESFLVTVAAQLSGRLPRLERLPAAPGKAGRERVIKGLSGAPGQCIGNVVLLAGEQVFALAEEPASLGDDRELERLAGAVCRTQQDLEAARARLQGTVDPKVLEVFDFYRHVLDGDQLIALARQHIRAGKGAFGAVRLAADACVAAFDEVDDDYIRARGADIRHIGLKLMEVLFDAQLPESTQVMHAVLFGDDVGVTDITRYRPEQLAGLVCMHGSPQSHSVLLARALGIPAVTGTGPVDHVSNAAQVVVDGDLGLLVLAPSAATLNSYEQSIELSASTEANLLKEKDLPAVTTDGQRVRLLVNTGLLADISPGLSRGAEGVGLYRSEIPFLDHETFPTEKEQQQIYEQVLAAYAPRPVTMRTLDIGGDKQLPYLHVNEPNPALGWRGIRFSLDNPATLATQLRAMLRADRLHGNLRILLPMITSVHETMRAGELLDAVIAQLGDEGLSIRRPPVGIMIEVPASGLQLSGHAPWIDFIAIGTNDLTQYVLAADRTNPRIAHAYDFLHPGVVRTVAEIAKRAQDLGIEVSVCGEMAADPKGALLLIGLGIRSLSMNAYRLPHIKAMIRSISSADAEEAARAILDLEHAEAIHECLGAAVRVRTE